MGGFHFKYQEQNLEIVKSYCYLGIDLTASGSFNLARTTLMEKARKALFPLLSTMSQFQIPCIKDIKLFKSIIQPIALYNSENPCHFSHHQIKAPEDNKTTLLSYLIDFIPYKVQHKFLEFILGVKRNCSNLAMLGEVGELPMSHHGLISMLSYWHRIALMQGDDLVKQALTLNYENGPAQSEWLASVQYLLNYLDLNHYFRNPGEIKNDTFTLICSQKLSQKLGKEWENKIYEVSGNSGQTNKLRFYKLFKSLLTFEPYLNYITDFQLRRTVTKFRYSDHTIEVERGRYQKLKFEERICKLCNSAVETEIHFLGEENIQIVISKH